jgi:hypothetical protein
MSLPTDTAGGLGGGDYFKPAQGQNKVLIVGDAVTGYEYWTADDKPVRSKTKFDEPLENVKVRQVTNQKTGEKEEKPDTQKFFWVVPVYDFADESFKTWQVTQKGIRDTLADLEANEDWGSPVGGMTLSISRSGEGLTTEYKVTPNPVKDEKELASIVKEYTDNQAFDLIGMTFGG